MCRFHVVSPSIWRTSCVEAPVATEHIAPSASDARRPTGSEKRSRVRWNCRYATLWHHGVSKGHGTPRKCTFDFSVVFGWTAFRLLWCIAFRFVLDTYIMLNISYPLMDKTEGYKNQGFCKKECRTCLPSSEHDACVGSDLWSWNYVVCSNLCRLWSTARPPSPRRPWTWRCLSSTAGGSSCRWTPPAPRGRFSARSPRRSTSQTPTGSPSTSASWKRWS